jgi:hypothetical protein
MMFRGTSARLVWNRQDFDFGNGQCAVFIGIAQIENAIQELRRHRLTSLTVGAHRPSLHFFLGNFAVTVTVQHADKLFGVFPHEIASTTIGIHRDDLEGQWLLSLADGDAGEVRGQFVELIPFPDIGWMIVTVGALDLNTKKDPASFGGDFGRLAPLCNQKGRGRLLLDVACRR